MLHTILISLLLTSAALPARAQKVDVKQAADAVVDHAVQYVDPRHYAGTVYTQSLVELYKAAPDDGLLSKISEILDRFNSGEYTGYGSFISYGIGGTAAPEMVWQGFGKYRRMAEETAAKMFAEQPRNADGVMLPPWKGVAEKNGLFVDPVFAVTPYMLYSGLISGNAGWIDYAAWMTLKTFSDLYDADSGLIHQARAVRWMEKGQITDDCWSRGNGWGAMALGALMRDLPKDNKHYAEVRRLARDYFAAVLKYQDKDGLWHQEMTWPDSYVEVSGSALLLYGIGSGIEAGILPSSYKKAFRHGIEGLLTYIDASGNVGNTCSGCLAWGDGSKKAYADHPCFCNEQHAFGPAILALAQALRLGVKTVTTTQGSALIGRTPACYVRYVEDRKADIAWENDRAAFRIYSQQVKNKVSSGVDYWAKKVEYPIIDRWYEKDATGGSYHKDEGEGCDFYAVGKNRGIGGIGIWTGGELLVPEPYESYRIDCNTRDSISFTVTYPAIVTDDDSIVLTETVSMKLGSYYYKASVSARTASGRGVILASGLTDFGKARIVRNDAHCSLALTERNEEVGEDVGASIVADPESFKGFATFGKDVLVLMELPSGGCVEFFAGAAWSRDTRFDPFSKRWPRITEESVFGNL